MTAIKCRCCGKMFRPASSKIKLCSDECRQTMHRKQVRVAVKRYKARGVITEKTCPICGKVFDPQGTPKKYCSPECKRAGRNHNQMIWARAYRRRTKKMSSIKVNIGALPQPYLGYRKPVRTEEKADWDYIHWMKKRQFDMQNSDVVTGEYTKEEEEVIRNMLDSGHTNTEVAKRLNRNISSVSHKARKLGYV